MKRWLLRLPDTPPPFTVEYHQPAEHQHVAVCRDIGRSDIPDGECLDRLRSALLAPLFDVLTARLHPVDLSPVRVFPQFRTAATFTDIEWSAHERFTDDRLAARIIMRLTEEPAQVAAEEVH